MADIPSRRKLESQKMHIHAALLIILPYIFVMAALKQPLDSWVIGLGLMAVGSDAVAMKIANALGDHGALKKGSEQTTK